MESLLFDILVLNRSVPVSFIFKMSREPVPLVKLPAELIIKILSLLLPDNVRSLRYVIIACRKTDHEILCTVAEQALNSQRMWLLNRWYGIWEETQAKRKSDPGQRLVVHENDLSNVQPIAERVIGKQYVQDTEVVDECDKWVSSYAIPRFLSIKVEDQTTHTYEY